MIRPSYSRDQLKHVRAVCMHECAVIDSICRLSIQIRGLSVLEAAEVRAWYGKKKLKLLAWSEYDELCILNQLDGLVCGEPPPHPRIDNKQILRESLPPLSVAGNDIDEMLSIIWEMCLLSVTSALCGVQADFSPMIQLVISQLTVDEDFDDVPPGIRTKVGGGQVQSLKRTSRPKKRAKADSCE